MFCLLRNAQMHAAIRAVHAVGRGWRGAQGCPVFSDFVSGVGAARAGGLRDAQ
ncbi:hypothetical protein A2U01_0068769, partial [Trifolium medium]|nr:hypothetical protein [Trifolium medium]